jgi:acetoacetyl-CoA synthetase
MSGETALTDTALLFRSVRAARSWLRAGAAGADSAAVTVACVTMKHGNDDPPVFMIPGAPGSILQLGPIVGAMTVPMPVYAIRPRGMAEHEVPFERLEEMAEYAIGVMREARPQGPYLLAGYSAGGLIALEMARQLTVIGQPVPLVVLLDTYPSRAIWPLPCHLEVLARQALRATWSVLRCPPRRVAAEIARRARGLWWYLAASGMTGAARTPIAAEGIDAASRRVHVATFKAGEAYRPSRYTGKVVFLQPEHIPNLEPRSPREVWDKFLTDLVVRRVPGSHLGMVDEGAAATAAEIGRCVAEALSM